MILLPTLKIKRGNLAGLLLKPSVSLHNWIYSDKH